MKRSKRKKRIEQIYATTKGNVSEIALTIDSRTGEISFGTEMINVYSEVTYERPKGPKVLSRIPQARRSIAFDAASALEKNFDFLCAVDTNTRLIRDKKVSAVGIVTFQSVWIPERQRLQRYWKFDVPFCIEYVEIKSKPENFGWLAALEYLNTFEIIAKGQRIGMVVDSDLGNVNDYNQRKRSVLGSYYLPANTQLLYASADAGKENVINKALAVADSVSAQCLDAVSSGTASFNPKLEDNGWFEGIRIVRPNIVRQ